MGLRGVGLEKVLDAPKPGAAAPKEAPGTDFDVITELPSALYLLRAREYLRRKGGRSRSRSPPLSRASDNMRSI